MNNGKRLLTGSVRLIPINTMLTLTLFLVEDTQQVYWSNLEIGLCFLAVNVPSITAYHTQVIRHGFLHNILSVISTKFRASNTYRNLGPNAEPTGQNSTPNGQQHVSMELHSLGSQDHASPLHDPELGLAVKGDH